MTFGLARRWWGVVDEGKLHSFESLVDGEGSLLTRTGERAACGWVPPGGVLESPEELGDRACSRCRDVVYSKPCATCDGDGLVHVCPWGHAGSCPCSTKPVECPDCDGRGTERLSDEEIEAIEGYAAGSFL